MLIIGIIAVLFSLYAVFDIFSVLVRVSGAIEKQNAAGSSFEKIMNTVKRAFMFLYPPLLGYMIANGLVEEIYLAIMLSFFMALISSVFVYVYRLRFIAFFCGVIAEFRQEGKLFRSFITAASHFDASRSRAAHLQCGEKRFIQKLTYDRRLLINACWVGFVYSSSIFLVNAVALMYRDYAVVVLQMIGAYNALGTIMLAFFVDPRVAADLDSATNLDSVASILIVAPIVSYAILGPAFFTALFYGFVF